MKLLTNQLPVALALAFLLVASGLSGGATPWGKDYFPDVSLTTHEGKKVRFFEDLIENKIVVVNFIYTSCPDTCPLETAQLVKVQEILGDRIGKDVFFYSISLDPERDTPAVLAEYRKKFRARWTFLNGDEDDVYELQKKLGLYLEEIVEGLNNHNVSMVIGNQATGRWMKRSPFENPYVLADQIGNWLDGWKRPPQLDSYTNAPKLRDLPRGEQLFRTRCMSCHTVTGKEPGNALGPDLLGVTHRREAQWLLSWLQAPDEMLAGKDPVATALFEKYNRLAMPNLRLNKEEALDLIKYLEQETRRVLKEQRFDPVEPVEDSTAANPALVAPADPKGDVVTVENGWVRNAHPSAKVRAGYLTLGNQGSESVTLTGIDSDAFASVAINEMARIDGRMQRRGLPGLEIPASGEVRLAPGGLHLVLKGRRLDLSAGSRVAFVLQFKSGRRQLVTVPVN